VKNYKDIPDAVVSLDSNCVRK